MLKNYKEYLKENFSEREPEEVTQYDWHDRNEDRDFTDSELEKFDDFVQSMDSVSDYLINLDERHDRVKITARKESSNRIQTYSCDCNNQTGTDIYYLSVYTRTTISTMNAANTVDYYKFKSLNDMLGFIASRITNKVSFKKIK